MDAEAQAAGAKVSVPFVSGRGDASQAQTDQASFAELELTADAFRNYFDAARSYRSPTESLIDQADQLDLTVPEMAALIGGMRAMGVTWDGSARGVLTDQPGHLTNDFFVNLMDMSTVWRKSDVAGVYEGLDRDSGQPKYQASSVDLVFGSNSELRAIAEIYAYDDGADKLVNDFVAAWVKVMQADRLDI